MGCCWNYVSISFSVSSCHLDSAPKHPFVWSALHQTGISACFKLLLSGLKAFLLTFYAWKIACFCLLTPLNYWWNRDSFAFPAWSLCSSAVIGPLTKTFIHSWHHSEQDNFSKSRFAITTFFEISAIQCFWIRFPINICQRFAQCHAVIYVQNFLFQLWLKCKLNWNPSDVFKPRGFHEFL